MLTNVFSLSQTLRRGDGLLLERSVHFEKAGLSTSLQTDAHKSCTLCLEITSDSSWLYINIIDLTLQKDDVSKNFRSCKVVVEDANCKWNI